MKWLDSARARLHLLFARRAAESRMNDEFRFHIEMETAELMRVKGLARDEARRQALAAFGGVETHKEAMRDGRGLAWLSGLSLDLKLGGRMLIKYPVLTLAGGLALAVAIAIGAGWYDMMGKLLAPTIPLPDGDRIVTIETQNILTNAPEPRVRSRLPRMAAGAAHARGPGGVSRGRPESRRSAVRRPSRSRWQSSPPPRSARRVCRPCVAGPCSTPTRSQAHPAWSCSATTCGSAPSAAATTSSGSAVKLGNTPATVIGVMPEGFGYPVNHDAWTPLSLRASYGALEGGAISVIGRLAPGVTREQANAELRVFGERAATALPGTHAHLRPRVLRLGELVADIGQFTMTNLPVLLVLLIACTTVGTLVYARTATREGEIALRSALGASRARIVGQLFVEALVLASVATTVGLVAADRTLSVGHRIRQQR